MAVWYSQDFETLSGDLVGQDDWKRMSVKPAFAIEPPAVAECLYVSGTHVITGTKSLQCNLIDSTPTKYRYITRSLPVIPEYTNHSIEFDLRYFCNVHLSYIKARTFSIRGVVGAQGLIVWAISFQYIQDGIVRCVVSPTFLGSGRIDLDLYSSVRNIRMEMPSTNDNTYDLYVDSVLVMSGKTYGKKGGKIDRLELIAVGEINFGEPTLEVALDNLIVEYDPVVIATASMPKIPASVMVNTRDQYNVVSWAPVTSGIVIEEITKGASGDYSDPLTHTGLSASPAVTKAIIDGETTVSGLPVEGRDFFVDRNGGAINWVPTSAKIPDPLTDYSVIYEVPITNVTGYNVYKSNLINGYDESLCATITTTDINGRLDTAFVDTDVRGGVQTYKVAAVNTDMVESELSEKVAAIKIASQIDNKREVIDRKLWTLDRSRFGEGILR